MHRRIYDTDTRQLVVDDYVRRGLSITEIRRDREIGRCTIHRILTSANVRMRPVGLPPGTKFKPGTIRRRNRSLSP